MVDRLKEVRAFVGFQTRSDFHSFEEMDAMLGTVARRLAEEHRVALRVKYGIFPPGSILWSELKDSISWCHIALFDISENNPNVMIEVGLAYGLGKHVLLLKNRTSYADHRVPSDLAAIYVPYEPRMLDSDQVVDPLVRGVVEYLNLPRGADYYFRNVWGIGEFDSVLVICSELDEPEKRQHLEPNEYIYLSKYGDADSLLEVLVTLHRLYPRVDVQFRSANEVRSRPEEFTGNLILIGGPDYNKVTELFGDFTPYEYVRGDREEDIYIRLKGEAEVLEPRIAVESGQNRILDYGFFVRKRNPYNAARILIMIGGAHTYGVFGAVKAFSYWGGPRDDLSYRNCKTVIDTLGHDPEFHILFEVHALDSNILTPTVDPSRLHAI